MFEKRKLEKIRSALHQCFLDQFHYGKCTVSSGFLKNGKKYVGAFVDVTKMNETLLLGFGEKGGIRLEYRLDKTLALKLTFTCTKGDDVYEIVEKQFYEYEDCDFDDLPPELEPFNDLALNTYTDDGITDVVYTLKNVVAENVASRADRLLDYVFNVCDVYLENLLEEYGEIDE